VKPGEEHAFLAAVVEWSDDAIISKLLDGTIRTWNAGAERLFGYGADEMVGESIYKIVPAERHEEERALLERLGRGERIEHFETVRQTKSGQRVDVALTISPIRGSGGRLIGASKIARDITARKRIDEALRESEERFRTLADNMTQLSWTCDRLGMATWYNRRWYEYTGTTWQTMQGDGWKSVQHPDHLERVVAGLERSLGQQSPWEDTFPLRGADASYRWFLSRAVPIRDEYGQVLRWFGTNTDITAQRDAEEALRDANRQKDIFLAMLGHELRNPLAAIRSATLLLQGRVDGDTLGRTREILERQGRHMSSLIDGLLDMSRIGQGRIHLERGPVDLAAVCRATAADIQVRSADRALRYVVDVPDNHLYVDGDRTRLTQVVDNLLSNAVQHTPDGGTIVLELRRADNDAVLTVRDTGMGIQPENLGGIFEVFWQEPSNRGRHGGLGLGLALVRSLVQLHQGAVEARSEGRGHGANFIVRLPLSDRRPAATVEAVATNGTRTVLIIEDNRDAAEMLGEVLSLHGHNVLTAANGADGIALAREHRPDVVLCDLGLPGSISGFEVARTLRPYATAERIRLVAVSGYGQPEDKAQSVEAGFDAHITKPIELEELAEVLRHAD
jgi:PAS domain S-box-containing protein